MLVEMNQGSLGVGTELAGGGAQGVGSLQGMAGLNAFAAVAAMADVNVEAAKDGPTRNLGLELLILAILRGRPVTIGAMVRQGNVDDLVGLAAGNLAMGLGAVILPGLASRRGRRVFGRPLGKGRGLTLAGPQDFLELRRHLLELRGQLANLGFQVGHPLLKLFVRGLGHP